MELDEGSTVDDVGPAVVEAAAVGAREVGLDDGTSDIVLVLLEDIVNCRN